MVNAMDGFRVCGWSFGVTVIGWVQILTAWRMACGSGGRARGNKYRNVFVV